jgi:hypothetical protein
LGAAIDTIVWSMNVIATAKIIAVRTRFLDRPPVLDACVMTTPLVRDGKGAAGGS